mgnify:CR=1 FL=1
MGRSYYFINSIISFTELIFFSIGEDLLDFRKQLSRGDLLSLERSLNVTLANEAMLHHYSIEFMDHRLRMSSSMSNDVM